MGSLFVLFLCNGRLFLVVFHVDVNLATLGLGDQLPRDSAGHDTRQEFPVLGVGVQPEVAVVDAG